MITPLPPPCLSLGILSRKLKGQSKLKPLCGSSSILLTTVILTIDGVTFSATSTNAELKSLNWAVPNTPSDSAYIRISDYYNPDIYDRSDPTFSIRVYDEYDYISINEVKMWIGNNGSSSQDPNTDGAGFYWPGGENAYLTSIFCDGLYWGGLINGQIRVNGNGYRQGLKPGIILPNGQPDDPLKPIYKVFKQLVEDIQ